jgi:hypothetical protein
MKNVLVVIGIILLVILSIFALSALEVIHMGIFEPAKENVRRNVFENTKSYVHGKIQDLSKYYAEYQKAETDQDKEVIANLIKTQFADFDENLIDNYILRSFLKEQRGY